MKNFKDFYVVGKSVIISKYVTAVHADIERDYDNKVRHFMYSAQPFKDSNDYNKIVHILSTDLSTPNSTILFAIRLEWERTRTSFGSGSNKQDIIKEQDIFFYDMELKQLYCRDIAYLGDRNIYNSRKKFDVSKRCDDVFHTSAIPMIEALIQRMIPDE